MPHSFSVQPGSYAVVRLAAASTIPDRVLDTAFVSVTRTADELSIVCREDDAPVGALVTRGWRMLKLHGPFAFDEVGVMLSFAAPLAAAQISILAIGTYDTDYILVKQDRLAGALRVLTTAGHTLVTE